MSRYETNATMAGPATVTDNVDVSCIIFPVFFQASAHVTHFLPKSQVEADKYEMNKNGTIVQSKCKIVLH